MADGALSDLKVLDISQGVSGPFCAKLLADYGAEVIKVEPPERGDRARWVGPYPGDEPHLEKSGLFLYLNANKRGITLDISVQTGKRIFRELVKEADVLVEDNPPGTMAALGLGYEALVQGNPRLIMAAITPFGQTGPYRDYKATDLTLNAMGGGMSRRGIPGREPLKAGGQVAQYVAGLWGVLGVLAALALREATGEGQYLDVSAMEGLLPVGGSTLAHSMGRPYPRTVRAFPGIVRAKDGWVGVNPLTQTHRQMVIQFMGIKELEEDPRFQTTQGWQENADALEAVALPWFADRGKDELMYSGQAKKIPINLVVTAEELVDSPHLKAREFFVGVEHPEAGKVVQPGAPFRPPESPWGIRRPAPTLGQHNEEIFCGTLGHSKEDLVRLRQGGII